MEEDLTEEQVVVLGQNVLPHCFLVVDNMIHNEHASEDEIVLYFHPAEVPLRVKIHIIQVVIAMINFSTNFSQAALDVVELKTSKFAYRNVGGEFVMVLSSSISDSNTALSRHLELVSECFKFYNGSVEYLAKKAEGNRLTLQTTLKRGCNHLIPLIRNFHESEMKFSPVPYTQLDFKYRDSVASHFIQAHQLVSSLHDEADLKGRLIGAVVLYKNSVVCTELDVNLTRFITNLVEYQYEKKATRFGESDYREEFVRVFVSSSEHDNSKKITPEKLERTHSRPSGSMSGSGNSSPRTSPSSSQKPLPLLELDKSLAEFPEEDTAPNISSNPKAATVNLRRVSEVKNPSNDDVLRDLTQCGLHLFLHIGRFSIATLVSPKHSNTETRDLLMEALLNRSQAVASMIDLLNAITVGEHPGLYVPDRPETLELEISDQRYNFFCLDEITEMQSGMSGLLDSEGMFSTSINSAHDLFSEKHDVSTLVLRNSLGAVYCRKDFGRETFFQNRQTEVAFEEFEELARQLLKANHNINFI